jgi:hypothetical protein
VLAVRIERGGAVPEIFDPFEDKRLGELPQWAAGTRVHALAPDGKTLATALTDGTILIAQTAGILPAGPAPQAISEDRLRALWDDLGASGSRRGVISALARGDKSVPAYFAAQLKPVKGPDAKQLARLLAALQADGFNERQQAMVDLGQWGTAVELDLREAYQSYGVEGRARAKKLLENIEARLSEPEAVRALRAIGVLEAIGSEAARDVLATMAGGAAGSRVTDAARQALARCTK